MSKISELHFVARLSIWTSSLPPLLFDLLFFYLPSPISQSLSSRTHLLHLSRIPEVAFYHTPVITSPYRFLNLARNCLEFTKRSYGEEETQQVC